MVKNCSYGPCNSKINPKSKSVNGAPGVFFVKFPSPKTELAKCQRWVDACGRKNFIVANITKDSYICSRHFDGFLGPTNEKPDPIPLYDVLTPNMIKTESQLPFDNFQTSSTSRVPSSHQEESFTTVELPFTVVLKKARSIFTRKQICLEKKITSTEIELQLVSLTDLKPVCGYALEMSVNQVSYSKHQNNYIVIQCIIIKEETYSVKLLALDKEISIEKVQPGFTLKSNDDIYGLLTKLSEFCICPGNPDKDMVQLYKKRKTPKQSVSRYNKILKTIFSNDCHNLIKSVRKRCPACSKYRGTLRKLRQERLLKDEIKAKSSKLLKKSKKDILLKDKSSAELKVMNDMLKETFVNEPKDAISAIFMKQQLKAMSKNKLGMRFDPNFVKLCYYLKNTSKPSYEGMTRSAKVPSTRTLNCQNHFVSVNSGFNEEFLKFCS